MNDALALVSLADAQTLANSLAPADTLPAALRKKPADVLLAILSGRSLGLDPTQSLRAIHIIEGKVTLSADAMGALCKRSPLCEYLQCTETTDERATFVTQRKGEPKLTTMTFTLKQAENAGLKGKGNWKSYPAAMLRARALSGLCRLVYPDLLLGTYDPDELDREERDVTPTLANSPATVDGLKAELRTRRMVISTDGTPPAASPPRAVEQHADDPATVGWGKNGHLRLDGLTVDQLTWYRDDACKKAEGGDPLWVARLARYANALVAELARTESAPVEAA